MDGTGDDPIPPMAGDALPPAGTEGPGTDLQPVLGELLSKAVRRLLYRSRDGLSQAARTGRERLELRQLQRDLDHFHVRLGKTAYHLVNAGEIDHPALRRAMERIDELEQRIDSLRAGSTDGVASDDDPR